MHGTPPHEWRVRQPRARRGGGGYRPSASRMAGSLVLTCSRLNNGPPSELPSIARSATKLNTRQPHQQVGRRPRHQSPARSRRRACTAARRLRATLDARPPARVASRAPPAHGTLRTNARDSPAPGTLTLLPGGRLPGRLTWREHAKRAQYSHRIRVPAAAHTSKLLAPLRSRPTGPFCLQSCSRHV